MNTLDTQYKDLLRVILQHGVEKEDRTGTGTKSIFGYTIRHNMKEGFPLLTTKKMHFKSIASELCWFLQGRTDLRYLLAHDNHIWTGDAYKVYDKDFDREHPPFSGPYPKRLTHKEFEEKIMTDDDFNEWYGDLGPIYGKQWRSWSKINFDNMIVDYSGDNTGYTLHKPLDQIANLIHDLKTNPDSRRLMVSAWNPAELDKMTLPPCHYGFQLYTRDLTWEETVQWVMKNTDVEWENVYIVEEAAKETTPKRAISLMWNQRSVDTFLGLPFNIASYGLLLEIIAKEVNMVPDQLIGNLGDTHLYMDHLDQAREQLGNPLSFQERIDFWFHNHKPNRDVVDHFDTLSNSEKLHHLHEAGVPLTTREPFALPKLTIESEVKWKEGDCLPTYSPTDFTLHNYQSHPAIKAPLSN
jgi:thymidylate synthase